ncbi:MAG: dihydrofolate reductase family protein [Nitrosomonas sp.]|nr:dihydrofolate reductase family protein [Nitrosomonas sp.]
MVVHGCGIEDSSQLRQNGSLKKNGKSQWITSEPARRDGHSRRARSCAILTGISSVRKDDPQLTVRYITVSRQLRTDGCNDQ